MLRRSGRIAVVALLVAAVVVWPGRGPTSEPPTGSIGAHLVDDWAEHGDGWQVSPVVVVDDLVLVGGEWEGDADVELRTRSVAGWTPWRELERHADHGERDGDEPVRSEPIWTGRSEALQLRSTDTPAVDVTTVAMSGPDGLTYSPQPTRPGTAEAGEVGRVVPRSAWDPDGECDADGDPEYAEDVAVGVVHHTHIFPHYSPDEADDLVRAICLYHVGDRGFDDIAYNLLIDQYGVVYEGREGGVEKAVVGSHTAGFNRSSFGVAVIGDFEEHDVPQPVVDALDRVLAWKFSVHGIDPHGISEVVSTGGAVPGLTRYPEGTAVTLPAIIGHRDTSSDSLCPGRHLYARLDGAPDRVAELMAAGTTMEVVPAEPTDGEDSGPPAGPPIPIGPPEGDTGGSGVMAAPATVDDLPVTGSAPTPLVGAAALGVVGLALGGHRRR